ncbi:KilA-N domain-containing protein [Sulfurimonas sp.]
MSKFNLTEIQGKNVIIDITRLLRDEAVYINATELAKQFNKDLSNYTRRKDFNEYIKAFNSVKSTELELIKTKEGKYGGTYIHSDLAVHFLRWLNVEFAIKCDMYIKQQIQQAHNEKIEAHAMAKANQANEEWLKVRKQSKTTRKELSDAIKSFCEYAQLQRGKPYKKDKCPYYKHITDIVYKALNISKPKGTQTPRDIYSGAMVEKIEYLEDMLINLIKEHIRQEMEYHEAMQNIKKLISYEADLMQEVA